MAIQSLSDIARSGTSAFVSASGPVGLASITQSGATPGQVPTWSGTAWVPYDVLGGNNVPPGFMDAVGGVVTYSGDYRIHTFVNSGTLTCYQNGVFDQVMVVAGGGGGGSRHGGGGGGGEVIIKSNHAVTAGLALTILIGTGGVGASSSSPIGANGGDTQFGPIIAKGGGRAGGIQYSAPPASGGSGGGGTAYPGMTAGAVGASSTNLAGGSSYVNSGGIANTAYDYSGGGGGGAGGAGQIPMVFGANFWRGGYGGDGLESSITGTAVRYAAGGAGSSPNNAAPVGVGAPLGGLGGGGNGDWFDSAGTYFAPTSGTGFGCGGGGSRNQSSGGNGSSGIVIVRYRYQ